MQQKEKDTHVSWASLGWVGSAWILGTKLVRSWFKVGTKLARNVQTQCTRSCTLHKCWAIQELAMSLNMSASDEVQMRPLGDLLL